jgi:hypothetical protein
MFEATILPFPETHLYRVLGQAYSQLGQSNFMDGQEADCHSRISASCAKKAKKKFAP